MIEVTGVEELRKSLVALGAEADQRLNREVTQGAEELLTVAQEAVPVASGDLRDSAFAEAAPLRKGQATATVGYTAEYAAAVHEGIHGGRHGAPQRWLGRAADGFEETAVENVYSAMREWVGGDGGAE